MSIHLKLLFATFVWGLTPTVGKILAPLEAPFIITFGRFLFACLWLFMIVAITRQKRTIEKGFLGTFLILGLTGVFFHNVLMWKGLEYISASIASLIFAFIVVQVAIIDLILYRKIPSHQAILGMIISVIGILIVVTDGSLVRFPKGDLKSGFLLIFGSALAWAIYTVVCRKALKTHNPLIVTTYTSVIGLILVSPFPLLATDTAILIFGDKKSLLFLIFLGVVSSAITYIWHQQAVEKIGVLSTSIYLNLVPIFGVWSATVLLGESINQSVILGSVLVFMGIFLVNSGVSNSSR